MKAKELMVGDWIQALCENYEPYDVVLEKSQITHINRETIYVANGNIFYGEDGEMRRYSVAEPIKLTEEILEKNGFRNKRDEWLNENEWFDLFRLDNGAFGTNGFGGRLIKMSYVHELQHALRLCKLNELADNLKLE